MPLLFDLGAKSLCGIKIQKSSFGVFAYIFITGLPTTRLFFVLFIFLTRRVYGLLMRIM